MTKNEQTATRREELRPRILECAMRLFRQKGIRGVRMDDISRHLSISKRTLYEIYDNKEQLLLEGLEHDQQLNGEHLRRYAKQANNELEVLVEALRLKLIELGQLSPLFFDELQKYEKVMAFFQKKHSESREMSLRFFKNGVEKGYFRKDIQFDIVMQMSDAVTNYVMQTRMYEKYSLKEIFLNYIDIQLRGLCTLPGLAILDKLLEKMKNATQVSSQDDSFKFDGQAYFI